VVFHGGGRLLVVSRAKRNKKEDHRSSVYYYYFWIKKASIIRGEMEYDERSYIKTDSNLVDRGCVRFLGSKV
jgi:hypothetical protein